MLRPCPRGWSGVARRVSRASRLSRQKAARSRLKLGLAMGALAVIAGIALVLALANEADEEFEAEPPRVQLERTQFGQGASGARVVAPADAEGMAPTVIFLHGWGELGPGQYRAWIEHLARRGSAVIVPRYQTSAASPPQGVLEAALTGIRQALEAYPTQTQSLVVAGHSAGGALAADYAATAASDESLPDPAAIFAVYPGRAIFGTAGIPVIQPASILPSTRIVALGSPADTVVGESPARQLVRSASAVPRDQRQYVRVTNPAVADHYAPLRDSSAAKAEFWRPLDSLIAAAR